jgi:ribosomal protein L40E
MEQWARALPVPTCCQRHIVQHQRLVAAICRPCGPRLLCGAQGHWRGMFRPDHPEQWGGHASMMRLLFYDLCRRCMALPDKLSQVEVVLQQRVHAVWN